MNVPIGIIAFIVIAIYCPSLKRDKHPHVDYAGAGLLVLGLSTLVLAIDNTKVIFADLMSSTGLTLVWLRVIMFSIIAVILALLVFIERRAKEPILPPRFFRNRNYLLIMTIATLFGAAFMGSILYLTQFNQQVFGATPTQSGLMLLPIVAGMTVTSVGVGQLISRTGKYKIYMKIGFAIATAAVIGLLPLTPDSSYLYEAIIMVFLGVGMGVAMPVISLVVQNEFERHDLGAATSSSQLFRGLGSTVGVALFGAILTAGFVSNLSDMTSSKYIQTLKTNPAASQFGSLDDTDTLLMLNGPSVKQKINEQSDKVFAKLPKAVREQSSKRFSDNQQEFASIVTHTYSDGMHNIFIVSAILMASATAVVFVIKEKPLRSAKASETPGVL